MHRSRRAIAAVVLGLTLAAPAVPFSTTEVPTSPRPATAAAAAAPPASADDGVEGEVAGSTSAPSRTPGGAVLAGAAGTRATAPSLATAIVPGTADRASVQMSTTYDVGLDLNFGSRVLTVDTLLAATNTSGGPVDRLELNTIAARLGGLRLLEASVDGQAVSAKVHDQTIVLALGGVLPEGETVSARIVYRATLKSTLGGSNWLFTRANGIADLYRWIPWVSRAVAFDRPNHGDPFVTAASPRVTVTIKTDRRLVLATTGDRIASAGLSQTFEARNVRDFTVTAAPDFRTGSRKVGDTTVRVYYRRGFPASAVLAQAAKALGRMNSLVGAYPYSTYKLVQSAGGYGMESPGLTWIPTGVPRSNLAYLVHHETAHQWFYGVVGADQANEPFTDEATADFTARFALGMKRASRCATARLDLAIYRYSSRCYYEVVYIQGGNFLDDLRRRMGSGPFWAGLRAYMAANRFGIAGTRSLLETLDAHTPLDLVPRYRGRFPRLY